MVLEIKQRKQSFFNGVEYIKGYSEPLDITSAIASLNINIDPKFGFEVQHLSFF
jgi:hypothetical protein